MRVRMLLGLLAAGLFTLACGGPTAARPTQAELDAEDDEDRYVDEEPDDDEDDDDDGLDPALLRAEVSPLELDDEPVALPGTGVSMRPPSGSTPMPFGSGFLARAQRVQVSVVVAVGEPEVLDAIRAAGGRLPEAQGVEDVTIAGQPGRIGRDAIRTEQAVLERSWLLVHDGTRGLGVVATYEAARASMYRAPLREALAAVQWDREVPLDAAAALGVSLGPVQGLEQSRRSTANLVYLEPGGAFPPEAGQVVLTVSPLPIPMQVPDDRISSICTQILARLVPAPVSAVELEGEVEDGGLPGCERLATMPTEEGPSVITYAAVLFHEGSPLLLTASADASQLATWRPRFASAARSLTVPE